MGRTRLEFQTRNPAAAAAIPPTNQTSFFMHCPFRNIIRQNQPNYGIGRRSGGTVYGPLTDCRMEARPRPGKAARARMPVHWKHDGQSTIRSRTGVRRPPRGEDAASGGGCGERSAADAAGGCGQCERPGGRAESGPDASCARRRASGADKANSDRDETTCGEAGAVGVDAAGAILKRGVAAGDGAALCADCNVPGPGSMEGTRCMAVAAGVA